MDNKFSFNTIINFDNHISSSINGYDLLDNLILNLSSFWAKKNDNIIDYGCTSGRLINKLADYYLHSNCIGYDITENNFINGRAKLYKKDITEKDFKADNCNLALSIFTLQFIKYNDRINLVKKIYNSLNVNGAFIVCEKISAKYGQMQEAFTFSNYDYKRNNFNTDEILNKEKDLRSIMNTLTNEENEKLFLNAGFLYIEPFFQSLNFKGWICIK